MRISDWSSDVCSSDLAGEIERGCLDLLQADETALDQAAIEIVVAVRRIFATRIEAGANHGIPRHDTNGILDLDIIEVDRYRQVRQERRAHIRPHDRANGNGIASFLLQVEIATDKRWHTCAVDLPSTDVSRRNTLRHAQRGDLGPIWPVAVNATHVARIAPARIKIVAKRSSDAQIGRA